MALHYSGFLRRKTYHPLQKSITTAVDYLFMLNTSLYSASEIVGFVLTMFLSGEFYQYSEHKPNVL